MPEADEVLLEQIFAKLTTALSDPSANPYGEDGSYAAAIQKLPAGLRAMAATHHLDVSLTLDNIGCHFLNFGEPSFVAATESGLRVLGLNELADWFHEAGTIMASLKPEIDGDNYYDCLEQHDLLKRMDELQNKAQSLAPKLNGSPIYAAWVEYARENPEEVFGHEYNHLWRALNTPDSYWPSATSKSPPTTT